MNPDPEEVPDSESALLTGQTERHLCASTDAEPLGARVHRDVLGPFLRLRNEGLTAGFDLRILSGFRSFEQQLSIWNRKATGQLAVLDSDAEPLDIARLTERDQVLAILRWSALPGASRHHWGTDLDVYDLVARPEGYEIELIPEEVSAGGMFGPLHEWLDRRIDAGNAFGFFRPYDRDRQGVAAERWHLSHGPTAMTYERRFTTERLREVIERADLELKEAVLENLDEIFERFVINTNRAFA